MSAPLSGINSNTIMSYEKPRNLCSSYFNGLKKHLDKVLTAATTEFFGVNIDAHLVGLTEEPLYFWKESDYFVTQIALTPSCYFQSRVSNTATGIFLDESLGKRTDNETYFKFKNITKLEAEVISSYCDFLFKEMKDIFIEKRKIQKQKEVSKDLVHLTLLINTPMRLELNRPCGKIILSFPSSILKPPKKTELTHQVDLTKYYKTFAECNVFIGKAIITLDDLKKLGKEDVLILDNSNLNRMSIFNSNYSVPFKVQPDQSIVLNIHSEEHGIMNNESIINKNLGEEIWNNLQVEVAAEFKKIKLPLGELRHMTEGLVIEVASLVNNEVRLHIDGKDLAIGELVIVGDKYGVMINKVLYKQMPENIAESEEEEIIENNEEFEETNLEEEEDDFNYDDLGLDDEF